MPKASVTVYCKDCGAEITKEATKSNRREAESWEKWAANQEWQCGKCWAKEKRAEEEARGLVLDVEIIAEPGMLMQDGEKIIRMSFSGDTMPHKDAIKELGYKWDYLQDSNFLGIFATKEPRKAWQMRVTAEEFTGKIKEAETLGAQIGKIPTNEQIALALAAQKEIAAHQSDQTAKMDAEIAELEKPVPPEVWAQKIQGHKTNRKIYGTKEKSVYADNVKIVLTDEEAKELNAYWNARDKYNSAVATIKAKYGQ